MAKEPSPATTLLQPVASAAALTRRRWRASPLHRLLITRPPPAGLAVQPRDFRPADPERGRRLLVGDFGDARFEVGRGDPWRLAAGGGRIARVMHGFAWVRDLLSLGDQGSQAAFQLWRQWLRDFGAYDRIAWEARTLEARVFHLAVAAPALLAIASESEGQDLLASLALQARHLISEADPGRAVERAAVAGLAGAALAGGAGRSLTRGALSELRRWLPQAVLRDGTHACRSPERGLGLLFCLRSLDDALAQLGAPAPVEVSRAIDRLAAGTFFFTMTDGRLPRFHGGEAGSVADVAAALSLDSVASPAPASAPYGRFERLQTQGLEALVDVGAPPQGRWSEDACAQPGSITIACDGRRLVEACVWAPDAAAQGGLQGPLGGSCLAIEGVQALPREISSERFHDGSSVWLNIAHDGWRRSGFEARRRLYLDKAREELRGEDVLTPVGRGARAFGDVGVRWRLAVGASATIAPDRRSAVLSTDGGGRWRLRTDAIPWLEPGAVMEDGAARPSEVLTLRAPGAADAGVRLRWKLCRDEA
jgi:uncharacterized heparinase superfamily protein